MHEEIINKRNGQQYYYKQNGGFIDNTQKYKPTMWYQNKTKVIHVVECIHKYIEIFNQYLCTCI